jgi:DNA-binding response OmpR family regulator
MPIVIISGADPRQTALPPGSVDIIDWIEKPIEPSRLVHAVELAIARTNSDQPLILHVEDDRDTLEIFSTALSGRGRVVGVSDLASARAFLRHRLPDVVILDLGLPDGSGADLLPILVDPDGGALPTIIYSAQDISGELQRSVDAVLTKSRRTLPSLVATVSKILDGKKRPVG